MLSIFPCAYLSSVFLWENVYLVLPIFQLGWVFVVTTVLCIVKIKSLSVWSFANTFFPFCRIVFLFCLWFPLLCKSLYVWLGPFVFYFHCLRITQENTGMVYVRMFCLYSFSFIVSYVCHFEFVSGVKRVCSNIIDYMWLANFPINPCWRDCVFARCVFLPPLSKIYWP